MSTHHVYRLYAEDETLLYIGCTECVETRIYYHVTAEGVPGSPLIHALYHHHTSEEYPSRPEARAAERAAIEAEAPMVNRQHNPKRWKPTGGGTFEPVGEDPAVTHAEQIRELAPTCAERYYERRHAASRAFWDSREGDELLERFGAIFRDLAPSSP